MATIKLGLYNSELTLPPLNWPSGSAPEMPIGTTNYVDTVTLADGSAQYNFRTYSPRKWTLTWERLTANEIEVFSILASYNEPLRYQNNWVDASWHWVILTALDPVPIAGTFTTGGQFFKLTVELEEILSIETFVPLPPIQPTMVLSDTTFSLGATSPQLIRYSSADPYDWLLVDLAARLIDWSKAGVWYGGVKGIPNYPVGITMQRTNPAAPYYVYGDDIHDDTAAINAATAACPVGYAVYFPAGIYHYTYAYIRSGVVIRGAGPGLTTFKAMADNTYFVGSGLDAGVMDIIADSGAGPDAGNLSGPITSGYTKGSSTVVVSAALAANLKTGDIVVIDQLNDGTLVNLHGSEGDCFHGFGTGLRAMGETKMVESKAGTSITFTRPLYFNYEAVYEPKLIRLAANPVVNGGVENLTINGNGYSMDRSIYLLGAAYCWVTGVETRGQTGMGVQISVGGIGNEVTRCYTHDPSSFASNNGYGVLAHNLATDNLVYDNITKWAKLAFAVGNAGGAGNVGAYNYCHSTNHYQPWWALPALATHGCHTYMNLFEGNIGPMVGLDYVHGSGSHNMIFRNWLNGLWNNPSLTSQMVCAIIENLNYYISFIGNTLGYSGMTGTYEYDPYVEHNVISIWSRGVDAAMRSSLIRHGNYDYITASTQWEVGIAGIEIPNSLYLPSKPAWFGAHDWPIAGPDVSGYQRDNPAKARWDAYAISGVLLDLF